MDELDWVSAEEAARRFAQSYYLRTGIQLEPERFLDDIQQKFNPYHDKDGKFDSAPGVTQSWGGQAAGMSALPGGRDSPARLGSAHSTAPAGKAPAKERLHTAAHAAKVREKSQARTIAISRHPPVRALLHQIARGEGVDDDRARSHGFASGYDVPFNYGRFAQQTKPLTQMTLGEIDALQVRMASHPENPGRSTPVGRYQFTRATLRELRSELELDDRQVFSAALQDRLASRRLEKRGLHDYVDGKISESEFQRSMANEWASIENPQTIGRTPKGQPLGSATTQIAPLIRALRRN